MRPGQEARSEVGHKCVHTRTHVWGLERETLILGFVLVPGVNFLLNIFPCYLIFNFFFFAFLKNLNIKRVRIEPLKD